MPINEKEDLMLHLAGTVRLPSPTPATGCVWVVAPEEPKSATFESLSFRVVHRVSVRLYISRLVRATDVRAIKCDWSRARISADPKKAPPVESSASKSDVHYKTSEQFRGKALEFVRTINGTKDALWLIDSVAFVNELAPVVLTAEAALTASESAEYYPPIVGDGSLARGPAMGSVITQLLKQSILCDKNDPREPGF
ncbi:MAG: hypothetical protein U0835_01445 [Isosphaeraceae bacterium]